jgi:4-hydroxy-2-oxoheptanedioate aldolase
MRKPFIFSAIIIAAGAVIVAQAQSKRLNPVISLLEQKRPVFGVYAPANGGRRGEPVAARPATELAKDGLAYTNADFLFSGSLEGGLERGWAGVSDFFKAMQEVSGPKRAPFFGLTHAMVLKIPKIDPDRAKAVDNISRELNLGAAGLMFVETESAAEVEAGIAAMRFKSKGGTRPDAVGDAPAHWGMSVEEYKKKADLWPLNPDGELVNWTIVESKEGLRHVREIAAVKGVGVLWPGAGTLRSVFSTTNEKGGRVLDQAAWENAIQQVLAACKEYKVPCGFPANANDIEMRMQQGFSVFVMNWGDAGFKTVDLGRKAAGR